MKLFGGSRSAPSTATAPSADIPPAPPPGEQDPDTTALAALVDEAYDAVVVTTLDGGITYWNKSAYRLYGRGRGLEIGGDLRTLVPEIVRPQIDRVLEAVAEGQLVPPFKRQHTYASGVVAVAEVAATPIRQPGGEVAGVGFFVRYAVEGMEPGDPLAIEAAEALYVGEFAPSAGGTHLQRALLRSEARYRAIVETADQGIALIDGAGTFVFVNRRMTEFLGAPEEALVGEPATVLLAGDPGRLAQAQESGAPQRYELFHSHPSGGTLCGLVTVTPIEDDNEFGPGTALVMVSDITHVKRVRDRNRSVVDSLTDLANATLFYERVERAVRLAPDGSTAAVLVADVDRFRDANASLGHAVADELLRTVGERIASVCPAEATVARIVGDQFAVFVEGVGDDPEGLRPLADRIHAAVSQPVTFGVLEMVPSVSIGIAMGLAGDPSPVGRVVATATTQHVADDVLRRAHAAMRSAREGGPGRTAVDEVRPLDTTAARMALVPELQRAIRTDQLTVSYQPVLDLFTNAPIAVEALVRWPHPVRGMLEPFSFLPIAEDSGLIAELGRWVRERAGQDAVAWRRAGVALPVSVNVSARELADPRFADEIGQLLERTGLPAQALVLEVPAAVFGADPQASAIERVRAVRELGCRIALDDFGAGYSSLSELGRLPLDVLKIDRDFVRNVADSDRATALVRSVVEVGRAFGLQVVAEGVETDAQRRALADLGCPGGQGFFWTGPLGRAELLAWMDAPTV